MSLEGASEKTLKEDLHDFIENLDELSTRAREGSVDVKTIASAGSPLDVDLEVQLPEGVLQKRKEITDEAIRRERIKAEREEEYKRAKEYAESLSKPRPSNVRHVQEDNIVYNVEGGHRRNVSLPEEILEELSLEERVAKLVDAHSDEARQRREMEQLRRHQPPVEYFNKVMAGSYENFRQQIQLKKTMEETKKHVDGADANPESDDDVLLKQLYEIARFQLEAKKPLRCMEPEAKFDLLKKVAEMLELEDATAGSEPEGDIQEAPDEAPSGIAQDAEENGVVHVAAADANVDKGAQAAALLALETLLGGSDLLRFHQLKKAASSSKTKTQEGDFAMLPARASDPSDSIAQTEDGDAVLVADDSMGNSKDLMVRTPSVYSVKDRTEDTPSPSYRRSPSSSSTNMIRAGSEGNKPSLSFTFSPKLHPKGQGSFSEIPKQTVDMVTVAIQADIRPPAPEQRVVPLRVEINKLKRSRIVNDIIPDQGKKSPSKSPKGLGKESGLRKRSPIASSLSRSPPPRQKRASTSKGTTSSVNETFDTRIRDSPERTPRISNTLSSPSESPRHRSVSKSSVEFSSSPPNVVSLPYHFGEAGGIVASKVRHAMSPERFQLRFRNNIQIEYARKLGLDPFRFPHLMYIVSQAMGADLPEGWHSAKMPNGTSYYVNANDGSVSMKSPMDEFYRSYIRRLLHENAGSIQRVFRGYSARKRYEQILRERTPKMDVYFARKVLEVFRRKRRDVEMMHPLNLMIETQSAILERMLARQAPLTMIMALYKDLVSRMHVAASYRESTQDDKWESVPVADVEIHETKALEGRPHIVVVPLGIPAGDKSDVRLSPEGKTFASHVLKVMNVKSKRNMFWLFEDGARLKPPPYWRFQERYRFGARKVVYINTISGKVVGENPVYTMFKNLYKSLTKIAERRIYDIVSKAVLDSDLLRRSRYARRIQAIFRGYLVRRETEALFKGRPREDVTEHIISGSFVVGGVYKTSAMYAYYALVYWHVYRGAKEKNEFATAVQEDAFGRRAQCIITPDDIKKTASLFGVDWKSEFYLLPIIRHAVNAPLPPNWECRIKRGRPTWYSHAWKETFSYHPADKFFYQWISESRKKYQYLQYERIRANAKEKMKCRHLNEMILHKPPATRGGNVVTAIQSLYAHGIRNQSILMFREKQNEDQLAQLRKDFGVLSRAQSEVSDTDDEYFNVQKQRALMDEINSRSFYFFDFSENRVLPSRILPEQLTYVNAMSSRIGKVWITMIIRQNVATRIIKRFFKAKVVWQAVFRRNVERLKRQRQLEIREKKAAAARKIQKFYRAGKSRAMLKQVGVIRLKARVMKILSVGLAMGVLHFIGRMTILFRLQREAVLNRVIMHQRDLSRLKCKAYDRTSANKIREAKGVNFFAVRNLTKGWAKWKWYSEYTKANIRNAAKIPRLIRSMNARAVKNYYAFWVSRVREKIDTRMMVAATRIQIRWMRHRHRQNIMALVIQRIMRCWYSKKVARNKLEELRQKKRLQEQCEATLVLQAAYRGHLVRKWFKKYRWSHQVIRRWLEACVAMRRINNMMRDVKQDRFGKKMMVARIERKVQRLFAKRDEEDMRTVNEGLIHPSVPISSLNICKECGVCPALSNFNSLEAKRAASETETYEQLLRKVMRKRKDEVFSLIRQGHKEEAEKLRKMPVKKPTLPAQKCRCCFHKQQDLIRKQKVGDPERCIVMMEQDLKTARMEYERDPSKAKEEELAAIAMEAAILYGVWGCVYTVNGVKANALECCQKGDDLTDPTSKVFLFDRPLYRAWMLSNHAMYFYWRKKYNVAHKLCSRALTLEIGSTSVDRTFNIIVGSLQLAAISSKMGNISGSSEHVRYAMETATDAVAKPAELAAELKKSYFVVMHMGSNASRKHKREAALKVCEAISIEREYNILLSLALHNMALNLVRTERIHEARAYAGDSVALMEKNACPQHPWLKTVRHNYGYIQRVDLAQVQLTMNHILPYWVPMDLRKAWPLHVLDMDDCCTGCDSKFNTIGAGHSFSKKPILGSRLKPSLVIEPGGLAKQTTRPKSAGHKSQGYYSTLSPQSSLREMGSSISLRTVLTEPGSSVHDNGAELVKKSKHWKSNVVWKESSLANMSPEDRKQIQQTIPTTMTRAPGLLKQNVRGRLMTQVEGSQLRSGEFKAIQLKDKPEWVAAMQRVASPKKVPIPVSQQPSRHTVFSVDGSVRNLGTARSTVSSGTYDRFGNPIMHERSFASSKKGRPQSAPSSRRKAPVKKQSEHQPPTKSSKRKNSQRKSGRSILLDVLENACIPESSSDEEHENCDTDTNTNGNGGDASWSWGRQRPVVSTPRRKLFESLTMASLVGESRDDSNGGEGMYADLLKPVSSGHCTPRGSPRGSVLTATTEGDNIRESRIDRMSQGRQLSGDRTKYSTLH